MANGTYFHGEQIIELELTEEYNQTRMAIDSVFFEGTAAGTFVFMLGTVSLSIYTTANMLGKQIVFNRSTNHVELVSGPTNGVAYVLLEQKK